MTRKVEIVFHWKSTGTIPSKWHAQILQLAAEHGIDLRPEDLVLPDQTVSEVPPALPVARWPGELEIGTEKLPVFVLDNGERVISRMGATEYLTGIEKQGTLERYIGVQNLKEYLPQDFTEQLVAFTLKDVTGTVKEVRGLTADSFLDICHAYVRANADGVLTDSQARLAKQAAVFLSAVSRIGLLALIDEATGYQYQRAEDALQTLAAEVLGPPRQRAGLRLLGQGRRRVATRECAGPPPGPELSPVVDQPVRPEKADRAHLDADRCRIHLSDDEPAPATHGRPLRRAGCALHGLRGSFGKGQFRIDGVLTKRQVRWGDFKTG